MIHGSEGVRFSEINKRVLQKVFTEKLKLSEIFLENTL